MALRPHAGHSPQVHESAFIAPGAELIGRVQVAEDASVWFGAVLRGDIEAITVGRGAMLGAGALLPEGREVPARMLALGVPARVVRPAPITGPSASIAERYVARARQYRTELQGDDS